ncbi:hypothetical protein SG09_77310 [Bradyrhizobium ottawaense]|jgi:hypothetical protein|uniref:Uncharacterized protein n=1 Tax=Bradyrhizobium diazoefficiens TaxID=1355477 RepID=A0A809Z4L6_9BRAD|nr:hypothetical protein CF64_43985 [Bradyrhizobium japonicum]BBO08381.1 hypothetical protein SG09_77310 [Bradyrhizobium ottawaense]BBZ91963.1 hypothetical protein F07S3_17960 [Bradyrhizobium diazoefficiens]GLR92565.1 hypothetical protein GCM10007858_01840 [Bradyrhizobium liaoningense]BBZ92201.1 hypothetical protein F07S3_20340 [Bradyrhizobium diazoefficiens]
MFQSLAQRALDEGRIFWMRNQATWGTEDAGFGSFGFFTPTQEPPENIQGRCNAVLGVTAQSPVRRNFLIQRCTFS